MYIFFVNATNIYHFKVEDYEIKPYLLCLGNISKYSEVNNMRNTGLTLIRLGFLKVLLSSYFKKT